jgi:hypothetical protein
MTMNMLPSSSSCTSVLSWRRRLLASALLVVAALLAPVHAQTITSAVPGLISYQGKVSNAAGTAVGAGTPVNRLVIFRIWSHQSNSTINDLVYSEQQTVTISEGEFSVLIGQGAAVSGTPLGYSEATKGPGSTSITSANVFAGATRFLGVTIDDGTGAADPEVSPRQQLVSSAYAMRAKYAESVGANGANTLTTLDNGNVGVGTANPQSKLDVNGVITAYDGGGRNQAAGMATEVGAAIVNFGINDSRFGTQNNASQGGFLRFDSRGGTNLVGLFGRSAAGTAASELLSITSSGNVGIGQSAPVARLDVGGNISLFDGGTRARSAGLQTEVNGSLINFGVNDSSSNRFGGSYTQADQGGFLRIDSRPYGLFQFIARPAGSTSTSEVMTILANGNVGIGNAAPTAKLHVNGSISATSLSLSGAFQVPGAATTHTQGAWLEWNKDTATGVTYLLNQRGTGSGGIVLGEVSTANAITENMRITADGKVGIGTTTPAARLDVNGAIMLNPGFSNNATRPAVGTARVAGEIGAYGSGGTTQDDGFLRLSAGGGTSSGTKSFIDLTGYSTVADMDKNITFGTTGAERMRITNLGRIGIGTSSPVAPLHVAGTGAVTGNLSYYIDGFGHGGPWTSNPYIRSDISIYASNSIVCPSGFFVLSDARTKNVIGTSNGSADLETLSRIQVTNYTFRDEPALGPRVHKKVIAQQVEQVFPQAVSRNTDVVADIYQPATITDGWIQLATDLRPGERVRLITEANTRDLHDVAEVRSGRFRTTERPKGEQIFVYGREVKDFRAVDYDAISMLNVSATQELARENEALKKRVAELEAKDRARDAKLAAIEKLLTSASTVMAQPAKPATANGQE